MPILRLTHYNLSFLFIKNLMRYNLVDTIVLPQYDSKILLMYCINVIIRYICIVITKQLQQYRLNINILTI